MLPHDAPGGLPSRGQLIAVLAVVMASRSVVVGRPIRRDEFHGRVVRTARSAGDGDGDRVHGIPPWCDDRRAGRLGGGLGTVVPFPAVNCPSCGGKATSPAGRAARMFLSEPDKKERGRSRLKERPWREKLFGRPKREQREAGC